MNPAIADAITRAAQESGVDPAFAMAVAERESNFNPNARSSVSIAGLYQMNGGLRHRYGAGDSADPYTQARGWGTFMKDLRTEMHDTMGRDPTDTESYLGHHFGGRRAGRMISGQIHPDTPVQYVFTGQELAANPHIVRAGTVGKLTSSITADMDRRQAKFGGATSAPDLSSYGRRADEAGEDFSGFGKPAEVADTAAPAPVDLSSFGTPA